MTREQCRAARALLGVTQHQLADAAKVSIATLARFEQGAELKALCADALAGALGRAGVEFIPRGVQLRKDGK